MLIAGGTELGVKQLEKYYYVKRNQLTIEMSSEEQPQEPQWSIEEKGKQEITYAAAKLKKNPSSITDVDKINLWEYDFQALDGPPLAIVKAESTSVRVISEELEPTEDCFQKIGRKVVPRCIAKEGLHEFSLAFKHDNDMPVVSGSQPKSSKTKQGSDRTSYMFYEDSLSAGSACFPSRRHKMWSTPHGELSSEHEPQEPQWGFEKERKQESTPFRVSFITKDGFIVEITKVETDD